MTRYRFALPVAFGWMALAMAVSVARAMADANEWMLAGFGGVLAVAFVATGFGLRHASALAATMLILTGFVVAALSVSFGAHIPFEKPRFHATTAFDIPWASDLRARLVEAASALPDPGRQLVPGLAVGDTSLVSDALNSDMKAVSLTHLVAVSGANCAIVTAGVIAVVAALGGGRWMRTLASLVTLAAFVAVVGPQASVIRAAVMAVILLISLSSGHPARGVPVLALAVVVLLLVDPGWAVDLGFTLSVLATGSLLILAPHISARLATWMPAKLATIISVPLSAELVCQPVIATLTPGLPAFGIAANILADPMAPVATVTGLLAAIVLPLSTPVGTFLAWLCWLPAQWIASLAHVCANLPFARLLWPGGLAGVALSLVLSAAIVCLLLWPRARRGASAVVVLTLGVATLTTVAHQAFRHVGMPHDWIIAACDVGQGDALLVRPSPSSTHVMLIDTGRDETALGRCLNDLAIDRLDLLVLTHYDQDHAGAYGAVIGRVDVALVGKPVDVSESVVGDDLRANGAEVLTGRAGLRGDLGEQGFEWRELWPVTGHPEMQTGNPGSLVIRTEWPESHTSALFLGDLGEDAQRALLGAAGVRPATVVKVAHHGSADQFDGLYSRLHAQIALISVGVDNGYGHPTDRALSMLAATGSTVERTDLQGMMLVRATHDHLEVWSER